MMVYTLLCQFHCGTFPCVWHVAFDHKPLLLKQKLIMPLTAPPRWLFASLAAQLSVSKSFEGLSLICVLYLWSYLEKLFPSFWYYRSMLQDLHSFLSLMYKSREISKHIWFWRLLCGISSFFIREDQCSNLTQELSWRLGSFRQRRCPFLVVMEATSEVGEESINTNLIDPVLIFLIWILAEV